MSRSEQTRSSVAFFSSPGFSTGEPTFSRLENGSLLVSGMPIFRSGSFRDSEGWEHEWDPVHMELMVQNFSLLRDRRLFAEPPVRAGHPALFSNNVRDLVGYVTNLYTAVLQSPADQETYTYILADFEVADLEAADKIERRVWRNRSAEIGMYTTNSGMDFWPTLVGFAYVDIPAVEGLNFSMFSGAGQDYSLIDSQGVIMSGAKEPKTSATGAPPAPAAPANGSGETTSQAEGGSVTDNSNFSGSMPRHEFSVGGAKTTDFAAVQAHIDTLEQFQREAVESGRRAFVADLVGTNKILASQEVGLVEFALSCDATQWEKFKGIYENAQALPLLGEHSVVPAAGGTPEATPPPSAEDTAIARAKVIYQRHLDSGMSKQQILLTDSGKMLKDKGLI